MKKISLLMLTIFYAFLPLSSEENIDKKITGLFKKHYHDPVIGEVECKINMNGLMFFSVFERKNLCEDPLVPDKWILVNGNILYRFCDIEKAVNEARYMPASENDALYASVFLLEFYLSNSCIMTGDEKPGGHIPDEFIKISRRPEVLISGKNCKVLFYVTTWDRHLMFRPEYFELSLYSVEFSDSGFAIVIEKEISRIQKKR